jgi:glucose/arabinose dehydrogenase
VPPRSRPAARLRPPALARPRPGPRVFARAASFAVFVAPLAAPACGRGAGDDPAERDAAAARAWVDEWTVPDSFSLAVDALGFSFPTSIAFVPAPGPGPRDPLYFVSELRGALKVVTNDRSVHVFAGDVTELRPRRELPLEEGETGFGAVCLDPAHGFVFATYVRRDEHGLLRNEIARFETVPGTFALRPRSRTTIAAPFARDEASISHQIGHCQVDGDLLYVGVGDGYQTFASRNVDTTLGKILRMTLDGRPAPGNPFAVDAEDVDPAGGAADVAADPAGGGPAGTPPRAFVWAYGFRNPFSLRLVEGRLFAADNGPAVDRLLEVRPGADYLWDGTDWSIGTGALAVIPTGLGSAQLGWAPPDAGVFAPGSPGAFVLAATGHPNRPGAGPGEGQKGVFAIPFDPARGRLLGRPDFLVKYRGGSFQGVAAAAVGPGGLYFAPLFPHPDGDSPVLRLRHDPPAEHPHVLSVELRPLALMEQRGCVGCHDLYGYEQQKGAHLRRGPPLEQGATAERIAERLASPAYAAAVRAVDRIDAEPYVSWAAARREVLAAEGDDRVRGWITYHVMEPRFDNPATRMPNLGLSRREAAVIADYLIADPWSPGGALRDLALGSRVKGAVDRISPWLEYRSLKLVGTGFALGLLAAGAGFALVRHRRGRRAR